MGLCLEHCSPHHSSSPASFHWLRLACLAVAVILATLASAFLGHVSLSPTVMALHVLAVPGHVTLFPARVAHPWLSVHCAFPAHMSRFPTVETCSCVMIVLILTSALVSLSSCETSVHPVVLFNPTAISPQFVDPSGILLDCRQRHSFLPLLDRL